MVDNGLDPLAGDPQLFSRVEQGELNGVILPARAAFIKTKYGPSSLKAIAAQLSPDARTYLLEPPASFTWYRQATLLEIDRVMYSYLFTNQVRRFFEFGRFSADRDLGAFLKSLLWLAGNPTMVMKRLSAAFGKYYRTARGEIDKLEKGAVRFSLHDYILPFVFCEQLIPGWVTRASELAGGVGVEVVQVGCVHRGDDNCTWECRWHE